MEDWVVLIIWISVSFGESLSFVYLVLSYVPYLLTILDKCVISYIFSSEKFLNLNKTSMEHILEQHFLIYF